MGETIQTSQDKICIDTQHAKTIQTSHDNICIDTHHAKTIQTSHEDDTSPKKLGSSIHVHVHKDMSGNEHFQLYFFLFKQHYIK